MIATDPLPSDEQFAQLWCFLWAALEISDKPAQSMAVALFNDGTINTASPVEVWDQWENAGRPVPTI